MDLYLFAPEVFLSIGVVFTFVLDLLFSAPSMRRPLVLFSFFITLAATAVALIMMAQDVHGFSRTLFSGMVKADLFSLYFKLLCLLATVIAGLLSVHSAEVERPRAGEYFALLLALTLAMFLLASANHFLMIFLAIEFLSVMSYILTAFKKNNAVSSEAALKYVVYGALASGLLLFGLSYLYGLTGSLKLNTVSEIIALNAIDGHLAGKQFVLLISVILVLAGFAYKIAAVPFHMWCPDVYEGAPTPITALLSVGPKAAGFAILMRFFYGIFGTTNLPWVALIGVISAATMTLGNLTAIVQNNVKRLLAYSSIAHAGYMLMAVAVATQEGWASILFYFGIYALMNLGAFLVVIVVRETTGSEEITAYKGLSATQPFMAVALAICLLSLVGLPPLGGFIGKFYIFAALMRDGNFWHYVLALIGVINSAISLYYYARIIKAMFLEEPVTKPAGRLAVPAVYFVLAVLLVVPVILLGIYWAPLMRLAEMAAKFIA